MLSENAVRQNAYVPSDFLSGGGELGALMRVLDWSKTPLGPVEHWPQSLKTTVSILVNSAYPMFLAWGPKLAFLYNDGYRPIFGDKHPGALGRPFAEVWAEIWEDIRPLVEQALSGERTWSDDMQLFMERSGYREECYFTFSYSPVRDESGGVGGMFCACTETTNRVLSERRTRTLQRLGSAAVEAKTVEDARKLCLKAFETNPEDVPFALFYQFDNQCAQLSGWTGSAPDPAFAPRTCALNESCLWPLSGAARGETVAISNLVEKLGRHVPVSVWGEPTDTAVVLPIAGRASNVDAALVLGINPRRVLNAEYREFLGFAAGSVATALASARAYEEERKRAEVLAEIDRAKTAFFSNVSHEFRTPLTLMLGPLEEVLYRSSALPAPAAENLSVAHRNGLRLQKLVNTLLDFSRIEAGRANASFEPTDLAQLTADLASNFRSAIEKAGLRFIVDCAPLPELIYVDREMWEKLVLNLLSNAFKYTFAGEITVRLTWHVDRVELSIIDTGIGIAAADLHHIFERFHRIRGARARTHDGTGIGLALLQELVKLHGGTIRVESEPDRGTTFTVSIPPGSAHLPRECIGTARVLQSTATSAEAFVEEALRWLPGGGGTHLPETDVTQLERSDPAGTEGRSLATAAPLTRPLVLLADDNADMRNYGRKLLEPSFEVMAAADGKAALKAIQERRPDLILCDVMMPELDGFGLLAQIRSDSSLRDIPFIMVSARAGEEARIEGVQAGADDYLVKPFSAREVLARVTTHIEMARMRREAAEAVRRSEARLAEEAQALARLNEVSSRLWQIRNLSEGLDEMLAAAIELLGADMGNIQILDPERRVLVIAAQRGFKKEFLEFFREVTMEHDSACGRALRSGKRTVIENVESDEQYAPLRPVARAAGYRAVQSTPLIGRDGTPLGMFSTHFRAPHRPSEQDLRRLELYVRQAADFIERHRSEQIMRESEERFRNMANNAPVMIWVTGPDDACTFLSRSWYEFTGQREETALGFGWLQAVHPEDRAEAERTIADATTKRAAFRLDYRLRRHDGVYRWAIDAAAPRFGPDGAFLGYIGSVIDITERKQAEEALRRADNQKEQHILQQRRLLELFSRLRLDREASVEALVQAITEHVRELIGAHQAVTSLTVDQNWSQAINGLSLSDKYAAWRSYDAKTDGSGIYHLVCKQNRPFRLTQAELETHAAWRGFGEEAAKHPPMAGWLAVPLMALDGRNVGLIQLSDKYEGEFTEEDEVSLLQFAQIAAGVLENVRLYQEAQREIAERERAENALRRANADLEQFAYSASHDLQEPIRNISISGEILQKRHAQALDSRGQELVSFMTAGAKRMELLVRDLLVYTQSASMDGNQAQEADAAAALEKALANLSAAIHEAGAEISHGPLPVLRMREVQLQQLFQNLIGNAIKYRQDDKPVRIDVVAERNGNQWQFSVKDNGIGIAPEYKDRVFGIFKRLHGEGKYSGTGIGLAICHRIVERNGGRIWVESDGPGKGSTFYFVLPAGEAGWAS